MELISDILFVISNGLLIPVLLLLIFFLVKGLVMAIGFLPEYMRQRKERAIVDRLLDGDDAGQEGWLDKVQSVENGMFRDAVEEIAKHISDPAYCERAITRYEIEVKGILGRSRSLIKFGPMLGLMGTLIPMGPALVGLASGDMAAMAYNMQVAFATTVVGMVIAAIGVATLQVNQRYYASTINDIEYMYNKLSEINGTPQK